MKTGYLMLAIALLGIGSVTGVGAGPQETQKIKEQQEEFLSRNSNRTNEACESRLEIVVD